VNTEADLKILLTILSISKLLPLYTLDTGAFMPGHQFTPAEYALQKVVESFGNLLFELAVHQLTHPYAGVYHFCQLENIDYLVLRYLNTSALPYDMFSEDWLFDGDARASSISETVCGIVSIWQHWRIKY
jgi:hypothetical protein